MNQKKKKKKKVLEPAAENIVGLQNRLKLLSPQSLKQNLMSFPQLFVLRCSRSNFCVHKHTPY